MILEAVKPKSQNWHIYTPCNKFLATAKVGLIHYDSFCGGGSHFEGFRPDWYISTIYYAWDTPFWSGTLDIVYAYMIPSIINTHKTFGYFMLLLSWLIINIQNGTKLLSFTITEACQRLQQNIPEDDQGSGTACARVGCGAMPWWGAQADKTPPPFWEWKKF